MPSQEVEFDELFTSIFADYIAPEDYDEDQLRGWCNGLPSEDRGRFEIAWEMDARNNRVLTQITHIPPAGDGDVWFKTDIPVDEIVPAAPPDDEAPEPPPWPEELEGVDLNEPAPEPPPWPEELEGVDPNDPGYDVEHPLTEDEIYVRGRADAWQYDEPQGRERSAVSMSAPRPGPPVSFVLVKGSVQWWPVYLEWANGPGYAAESVAFLSDFENNYRDNATWPWFDYLVDTYIAENAPRGINVAYSMFVPIRAIRAAPVAQRAAAPPADVFNAAYEEINRLLSNGYRDFTNWYAQHGG